MKPYLELLGSWEPVSDGKMTKLVSLATSFSGSCEIHFNHWSTSMKPEKNIIDIIMKQFSADFQFLEAEGEAMKTYWLKQDLPV